MVQIIGLFQTAAGAGLAVGMFFLGFFIAIIIMAIVYAYKRKKERERNFFNIQSSPVNRTEGVVQLDEQ